MNSTNWCQHSKPMDDSLIGLHQPSSRGRTWGDTNYRRHFLEHPWRYCRRIFASCWDGAKKRRGRQEPIHLSTEGWHRNSVEAQAYYRTTIANLGNRNFPAASSNTLI